jgi:hypothetical protein
VPSPISNVSWFPQVKNDERRTNNLHNELIDFIRQTGKVCFKKRALADVRRDSTSTRIYDVISLTYELMVVDYSHVGSASDVCHCHFEPYTPDVHYSPDVEKSAGGYISIPSAERLNIKIWHNLPVWVVGFRDFPDHPFFTKTNQ